ncbi:MAG TPA: T9SS type A sorting domain-containing protein [Bacteroidia bacterium]|nr:T9SS type A sorting domain-containing protein [Bacteroidia bacterium]HNS13390.1 T9SS type A sorting domain-containing protein [Bacteroidia bacterium]
MIHQTANASHMLGADLSYSHLSGTTYKVKYTLYRDCNGIPAPSNMNLKVQSITCTHTSFYSLELDPGSGNEISNLCEGMTSICDGGNAIGVQVWNYSAEVDVPFACTDWNFSVTDCCRSTAITTISNPAASNIYLHAFLNNTLGENSLGEFKEYAKTRLYVGQEQSLNSSVDDKDGDSLVYCLAVPETGEGQFVNFLAPYHANKPLGAEMNINKMTGEISIIPTHILNGVFSVLVKDYRNGVLIGSVSRDVQVAVTTTSNSMPGLSGINGQNTRSIMACKFSLLSFDILTHDQDIEQQLSVSWDTDLPDARITKTNSLKPIITVSWLPVNLTKKEFFLTVRVRDNACPFNAESSETYIINVSDLEVQLKSIAPLCEGESSGSIQAIVMGGIQPYSYQWSEINSTDSRLVKISDGNYSVQVSDGNQCSAGAEVNLKSIYKKPLLNLQSHINGCFGKSLLLEAGSNDYSYKWSDNSTAATLEVQESGIYSIEVTNDKGCLNKGQISVNFENCNDKDSKYANSKNLTLYPNPASDNATLLLPGSYDEGYSISLMDPGGRLIETFEGGKSETTELSLNLSNIKPGVYFLLIHSGSEVQSLKFCKQ